MKLPVVDVTNKKVSEMEMPSQFNEEVRSDLIKRAVVTIQKNNRQPYGAKYGAGLRASGKLSRRRRHYRGSYGIGISRIPRKILSRRGTRMNWAGAVSPGTRGGRQAHPPKAGKILNKKINKKEKRKAIRSALSATVSRQLVVLRGHQVPEGYPIIIESSFENLEKTSDVKKTFENLGLLAEMTRTSEKTIRSGKGKLRSRKYKRKIGPLIVVSKQCKIMKSSKNIPGVDVVTVNNLNAELLAPGAMPGRLTIFTDESIKRLKSEKLFL